MKKRGNYGDNFRKNVWSTLLFGALAFLALFALWATAYVFTGNSLLMPSLKETFKAMGGILRDKAFYTAYFSTLARVFKAFLISVLPAAVLAVAAYACVPARKLAAVFVSDVIYRVFIGAFFHRRKV